LRETWLLRRNDAPGAAMGVFKVSIYYLALVFLAVAVGQLVPG
jgi:heme O synthase-like polyprenyltransferase